MKTVGHYTLLGGGVFGPVIHFWYRWLDRVLPVNMTKLSKQVVIISLKVQQLEL